MIESEWDLIGYESDFNTNIPIYYSKKEECLRVKFREGVMGSDYFKVSYYKNYSRENRNGLCNRAFDLLIKYKEIC